MSEAEQTAPAEQARSDVPWLRLSPRMLLIHPIRAVGRLLPALLSLFFIGSTSSSDGGLWWTAAGTAAVVLVGISMWFTTRFRIADAQVERRSGLLFRRRKTTPLDRVRTVDISSSPMHRVLGLAKVTIGTGAGFASNPDWLVLDGLPADTAQRLRSDLLHGKAVSTGESITASIDAAEAWSSPVDGDADPDEAPAYPDETEPERELYRLRNRWIAYAPFTISGVLTAVGLLGFGWQLLESTDFAGQRASFLRDAVRYIRDAPLLSAVPQIAGGLLVIVTVLSVGGYVLAFWGFRLSRHEGGTLHVTRGLLTTRATSIEERRLRGVEVSQPLLLRAVRGARLLAIATGLKPGSSTTSGNLLAPPSPYAVVSQVAIDVIQDRDAIEGQLRPHGAAAKVRRYTRAALVLLALVAVLCALWLILDFPTWPIFVAVVLLLLSPLLAADRYRALGHAIHGRYLVSQYGSIARRRTAVDTTGIIGWTMSSSLFQRRSGLVTLSATTAAGRGSYDVPDVEVTEAVNIARRATPGLLEQFAASRRTPEPDPRGGSRVAEQAPTA